ncbi:hypothetical protein Syun_007382 [Stephania yunnanensis]|uniref:Cupin type-2 domain-containing protein n=1 Tax=Stephania yunnanensis TaxID=152371 RepID=A0AAP0KYN1_9MAGN
MGLVCRESPPVGAVPRGEQRFLAPTCIPRKDGSKNERQHEKPVKKKNNGSNTTSRRTCEEREEIEANITIERGAHLPTALGNFHRMRSFEDPEGWLSDAGVGHVGEGTYSRVNEAMATCVICSLAENGEFASIEGVQGGTIKILRKNHTSAIIRLSAGGVEPAHHHTFGQEVVLMSGRIKLWDSSIEKELDLKTGDYLFTSAWNVHRVKSFEESELFIRWEGEMDTFRDEDLETAKQEIAKVSSA